MLVWPWWSIGTLTVVPGVDYCEASCRCSESGLAPLMRRLFLLDRFNGLDRPSAVASNCTFGSLPSKEFPNITMSDFR
ncbi:hypothetical protein BJX61DRAFT_380645 [Aspergillus egyptiacus]|nr:hypothetical protein BJX61DRAFT_380645 [Aspergillus egyptiacus]